MTTEYLNVLRILLEIRGEFTGDDTADAIGRMVMDRIIATTLEKCEQAGVLEKAEELFAGS